MKAFRAEAIRTAIQHKERFGNWCAMALLENFRQCELIEKPVQPYNPDRLKIVVFNIERGQQIDLTSFYLRYNKKLQGADIIIANELDDGMLRSGNQNITKRLADDLNMNACFALEFLEIAHPTLRDQLSIPGEDGSANSKGFHGNATFSKLPIIRSEVMRLPIYYDWFQHSQKRIGSRIALFTEVLWQERPLGIVNVHFENNSSPAERAEAFALVDSRAGSFFAPDTAYIIGGDINTNTVTAGAFEPLFEKEEQQRRLKEVEKWEPVFSLARILDYQIDDCNILNKVTRRRHHPDRSDIELNLDWFFLKDKAVKDYGIKASDPQMIETYFRLEDLTAEAPLNEAWRCQVGQELSDHNAILFNLSRNT